MPRWVFTIGPGSVGKNTTYSDPSDPLDGQPVAHTLERIGVIHLVHIDAVYRGEQRLGGRRPPEPRHRLEHRSGQVLCDVAAERSS